MRKINVVFAAVFAAALILGGINMFTAVGAVDKDGMNAGGVVGTNYVRPSIDKNETDTVDKKNKNIVRSGRKIQVDGFLLEWSDKDANVWPGSNLRWDAVSTVDGVAGYVSLPPGTIKDMGINTNDSGSGVNNVNINTTINNDSTDAANRPDLVLTLRAVNTGRTLKINLPGQPSGPLFAFDKGEFDAGGPLTAEWIVPWDYFDDDEDDSVIYELTLVAEGADVGKLQPLVLTIVVPNEPQASGGLLPRLTMAVLIAALTVVLIVTRRRQMREKR